MPGPSIEDQLSSLNRRLAAVMFTDMAGYTALMQADEPSAVEKRDLYVEALERQRISPARIGSPARVSTSLTVSSTGPMVSMSFVAREPGDECAGHSTQIRRWW
jgi:hypothetical protein